MMPHKRGVEAAFLHARNQSQILVIGVEALQQEDRDRTG